jgi:predicted membrane-bound spermidine synthase
VSVLERVHADGRLIEVRAAGRTLRLYVDGVLHTSYSPVRPLTGAVWDPLALSAFLAPPGTVKRCLLLGVGGGAAIHLLRRHVGPEHMVAVDIDRRILGIAREWFGVEGPDVELVEADATRWVRGKGRGRFDLVVDDLFEEVEGIPVRHIGTDERGWWRRLEKRVALEHGVLVVNFGDEGDLYSSSLLHDLELRLGFPAALRFSFAQYENAIVALMRRPISLTTFRRRLAAHPVLGRAGARRLMRFRIHPLWPR